MRQGSTMAPPRSLSRARRAPVNSDARRWRRSSRSHAQESIRPSWGWVRSLRSARRSSGRALSIKDIDLFELNEAFAAQALAVARELGLDPAEGQHPGWRSRAWPSDRRQRRPDPDNPYLCAPCPRRRKRGCIAVHRGRNGHRHGRVGVASGNFAQRGSV